MQAMSWPWTWEWMLSLTYLALSLRTRETMPLLLLKLLSQLASREDFPLDLESLHPAVLQLPLQHASQSSLDESSQQLGNEAAEPKRPPYRNMSNSVKVVDGMNAVRIAGLQCDLTLENLEITAHKMVLAACSHYFYTMFTGFTESVKEQGDHLGAVP